MARTSVTLDPDVEQLLRDAMRLRGHSFNVVLNQAVRDGLAASEGAREGRFKVRARPMGLRTGTNSAALNRLVGNLEADAFLALNRKLEREKSARQSKRK